MNRFTDCADIRYVIQFRIATKGTLHHCNPLLCIVSVQCAMSDVSGSRIILTNGVRIS